jgi:GDP-4-dehydro-6-deoxy-D-mannose reductase
LRCQEGTDWRGDLREERFVTELVAAARATHVFHLAGALPGRSVRELYEHNVNATNVLLGHLATMSTAPWVALMSSSAVYGRPAQQPITEAAQFSPTTPYGTSKAAQELVAVEHWNRSGLRSVRARLFNVIGPGQPPTLLLSSVAAQVARLERVGGGTVEIGNRAPCRDFVDVRDVSAALVALAEHDAEPSAYNVCSGVCRPVGETVDELAALSVCPVTVSSVPGRYMNGDVERQVGSASKIQAMVGWQPRVPLSESLRDLLDWWRGRVETSGDA